MLWQTKLTLRSWLVLRLPADVVREPEPVPRAGTRNLSGDWCFFVRRSSVELSGAQPGNENIWDWHICLPVRARPGQGSHFILETARTWRLPEFWESLIFLWCQKYEDKTRYCLCMHDDQKIILHFCISCVSIITVSTTFLNYKIFSVLF